jgi:hypothetical protein
MTTRLKNPPHPRTSSKTRLRPSANGRPTSPAAEQDDKPHPVANAFPEASPQEMFNAVVGIMQWHVEQMGMQLRAVNRDTLTALSETADDALKVCALARLLWEAADTAR